MGGLMIRNCWTSCSRQQGRETCEDVRVSSDLMDRQRQEVNVLMREFAAVLDDRPGMTHLVEHEIEVTTNKPVQVKQYPMPYSVREAVNQEVLHMLEMGVGRGCNNALQCTGGAGEKGGCDKPLLY